jgi:hypothetical protein
MSFCDRNFNAEKLLKKLLQPRIIGVWLFDIVKETNYKSPVAASFHWQIAS